LSGKRDGRRQVQGRDSLFHALTPRRGGGGRRRLLGVAGVLVLGCLLVAAAGVLGTGRLPAPWRPAPVAASRGADPPASSKPAPSATPDQALAQARAIVAAAAPPTRLVVPSINVNAAVEQVGMDSQGRMGVPSQAGNVAWFKLGATPGDVGNAVIAGHLDWTNGPAVFWYLGRVHKGDAISVVRADGSSVKFVADSTATVPYNESTDSLFTIDGPPSLTLITCAGAWDRQRGTYLQRLVVHATLVATTAPSPAAAQGG
jgi:LPXTG-site transpeptidase (sortase) family protein